jgi:hypothetical protein
MKTNYVQRVHSIRSDRNVISHVVKENNWFININKYKKMGLNLNFFTSLEKRYK